jgi:hypothetical protein
VLRSYSFWYSGSLVKKGPHLEQAIRGKVQFLGKSLDTKRAKAHLRVFYTLIHSTTMAQRVPLKAIDGNRGYKQELSV